MKRVCLIALSLVTVVGTLLTSGCSSLIPPAAADPTRFYILTADSTTAPNPKARTVGVRPIDLPGYLRSSRTLVVKSGANEVRFADFHRWAEPLESGIARILRERMGGAVAPGAIYAPPFPADVVRDADVSIRVIRCEGEPEAGRSVFIATYVITPAPGKGGKPVSKHFEAPTHAWDGRNYAALAQALSDSVEALADQIAADLP